MAGKRFFWVGATLTTTNKLDAFSWGKKENWREEYIPTTTSLIKAVVQTTATSIPGASPKGPSYEVDEAYFGVPLFDPNGNPVPVKSPCLWGGVTGAVDPLNPTQGQTWEHAAVTFGVNLFIDGGTFFPTAYKFPVIGGGITGGNGYWANFDAFKTWACSQYNITNANDITSIFGSAQVAARPNCNQLKIKAQTVSEKAVLPTDSDQLMVSLQLPRTYTRGNTYATTVYTKDGQNVKTIIQNSIVAYVDNSATLREQTVRGAGLGTAGPADLRNNLTIINSVVDKYQGSYDDPINIKPDCKVTTAEILSPIGYTESGTLKYTFAKTLFSIRLSGKYGAYYTYNALGLTGTPTTNDGTITLGDTKHPEFGQNQQYLYQVMIGEQHPINTSYIKTLNVLNNTVALRGKTTVENMNSDNCYIINKSEAAYYTTDTVNIVYLNLKNGSSLDLTATPQFDRWFFGKMNTGDTLVQGGIFAFGTNNTLYGSPGTKFFNDILWPSMGFGQRTGGKQLKGSITDTSATLGTAQL
jgi:hypothetical protein